MEKGVTQFPFCVKQAYACQRRQALAYTDGIGDCSRAMKPQASPTNKSKARVIRYGIASVRI